MYVALSKRNLPAPTADVDERVGSYWYTVLSYMGPSIQDQGRSIKYVRHLQWGSFSKVGSRTHVRVFSSSLTSPTKYCIEVTRPMMLEAKGKIPMTAAHSINPSKHWMLEVVSRTSWAILTCLQCHCAEAAVVEFCSKVLAPSVARGVSSTSMYTGALPGFAVPTKPVLKSVSNAFATSKVVLVSISGSSSACTQGCSKRRSSPGGTELCSADG
jgi:hypothetical protein